MINSERISVEKSVEKEKSDVHSRFNSIDPFT